MDIIIQGLRVTSTCNYLKITNSEFLDIHEDLDTSCLYIDIPRNLDSCAIEDHRIKVLTPQKLVNTDYLKITNPMINVNGLRITKLVYNDYIFSQYIVSDITEFEMHYNDQSCTVLIPELLSFRIDTYINLLNKNPFIKVLCTKCLDTLNNINPIVISNQDLSVTSKSTFKINTKETYTKYILSEISVMDSLITQLRGRLSDYGFELLRLPIDDNAKTRNIITYRFLELGKQISYKNDYQPMRYRTDHSASMSMTVSTPDLAVLSDFKVKYQNLEFLTDFTVFYTNDIFGRSWSSRLNWSPIDTSFNNDYSQNEEGNIAFSLPFQLDIVYPIVEDRSMKTIQSTILNLLSDKTKFVEKLS